MDALPLPPEPLLSPAGDPGGALGRPPRPGDLTTTWRTLFAVGWAGVVMGVAAVLKTSRTMGLATWWLGPEADPTIVFVEALPVNNYGKVLKRELRERLRATSTPSQR